MQGDAWTKIANTAFKHRLYSLKIVTAHLAVARIPAHAPDAPVRELLTRVIIFTCAFTIPKIKISVVSRSRKKRGSIAKGMWSMESRVSQEGSGQRQRIFLLSFSWDCLGDAVHAVFIEDWTPPRSYGVVVCSWRRQGKDESWLVGWMCPRTKRWGRL